MTHARSPELDASAPPFSSGLVGACSSGLVSAVACFVGRLLLHALVLELLSVMALTNPSASRVCEVVPALHSTNNRSTFHVSVYYL